MPEPDIAFIFHHHSAVKHFRHLYTDAGLNMRDEGCVAKMILERQFPLPWLKGFNEVVKPLHKTVYEAVHEDLLYLGDISKDHSPIVCEMVLRGDIEMCNDCQYQYMLELLEYHDISLHQVLSSNVHERVKTHYLEQLA